MTVGGIEPIFLRVDPGDIALVKFLFESYEGVGIVRTLDRKRAVIVVLAVPDFLPIVRAIIESLREQIDCREVPPPPEVDGDWLLAALDPD